MHDQMRVGDAAVNGLDTVHRQNIPGWGPGELISAVAGAAGNRQRVNAGISNKLSGLLRVSQQLVMAQLPRGANAILLACFSRFQRTEATDFTLDGNPASMRHVNNVTRNTCVVVVVHRRFTILAE